MIRIGKLKVPEYKGKLARERLPSAKSERSRRYQKNKPKYGARSTNEVRNKANPYKIRRISSKLNEQVATPVVKKHIVEQAINFDTESSSEKTMFMRKRSVAKLRESFLSSSFWGLTMVPSVFIKVAAFTFCTVTPVEFASPFSMLPSPEKKKN